MYIYTYIYICIYVYTYHSTADDRTVAELSRRLSSVRSWSSPDAAILVF